MTNGKLSASYQDAVKGVRADKTVTALIRTKMPEPDRQVLEQVQSMMRVEHLATRRSDLLDAGTSKRGRSRTRGLQSMAGWCRGSQRNAQGNRGSGRAR